MCTPGLCWPVPEVRLEFSTPLIEGYGVSNGTDNVVDVVKRRCSGMIPTEPTVSLALEVSCRS